MEELSENAHRQYGLDWVRAGAFTLLIFYHTGMFFVSWDFHFKNPVTSRSMEIWMLLMNQWRLPLLFFVSGAGISFALKKRSGWHFTKERFKRLLVPIVFGMLVIVPPQIYMERLYKGQFTGSYLEFYPSVYQLVPYPEGGSLSWHHLWFVVYLLFYSLIGLPLFLYLRSDKGKKKVERIAGILENKAMLYAVVLPIAVYYITLSPIFESTHGLFDDWFNHAFYMTILIYGYTLALSPRILAVVKANRKTSLTIALSCTAALLLCFWLPQRGLSLFPGIPQTSNTENDSLVFFFYLALKSLNLWCCILAIMGYALRHLNFSNGVLKYANEAVYPFYILHQSVMLVIGYYILQWEMGVAGKYFAIATGMFLLTWLLYETLIRRFAITRFLFGMKPSRPESATASAKHIQNEYSRKHILN